MINYKELHKRTKEYIEEHLPEVLEEMELRNLDAYIDDYVDLDAYRKPRQLFYQFNAYNFEPLSNESNNAECTFSIFLTFIGQKSSDLSDVMLVYTMALEMMFAKSGNSFEGLYDYGIIESTQFYQAAEGDKNKKVAEITFRMNIES